MSEDIFRFGTVGTPKSKPKSPGGSVGGVQHIAKLGLSAMELGWVRSVRVSESTASKIKAAAEEGEHRVGQRPYKADIHATTAI